MEIWIVPRFSKYPVTKYITWIHGNPRDSSIKYVDLCRVYGNVWKSTCFQVIPCGIMWIELPKNFVMNKKIFFTQDKNRNYNAHIPWFLYHTHKYFSVSYYWHLLRLHLRLHAIILQLRLFICNIYNARKGIEWRFNIYLYN